MHSSWPSTSAGVTTDRSGRGCGLYGWWAIGQALDARPQFPESRQNNPEYLYQALDFVAQGKVKTIVETYPLAEAPKAYERVAEGKARFRAVLAM